MESSEHLYFSNTVTGKLTLIYTVGKFFDIKRCTVFSGVRRVGSPCDILYGKYLVIFQIVINELAKNK